MVLVTTAGDEMTGTGSGEKVTRNKMRDYDAQCVRANLLCTREMGSGLERPL